MLNVNLFDHASAFQRNEAYIFINYNNRAVNYYEGKSADLGIGYYCGTQKAMPSHFCGQRPQ